MKTLHETEVGAVTPAMIDRLVDGELGEADRAALLRALDREPDGWKRCAVAFLEAQAWRSAVAAGAGGERSPRAHVIPARRSQPRRQLLAVAAAIAVAFGVGFVSRGPAAGGQARFDRGRTVAQHSENEGPTTDQAHGTAGEAAAVRTPGAAAGATPITDQLRARMERQGYRVEDDRRIVPVALRDGRKVAVPVDKVSLRYVGQRIH